MGSGNGFEPVDWIWRDGEFVPWHDARVHLLATAVQFGTSVFEGIRAYETKQGPAIFRLDAHIRRLFDSARIYRMVPEYTPENVTAVCKEVVVKNGLTDCYIRPMILRGFGAPGLNPLNSPIETYVPAWAWGTYLGEGALAGGVDVCVSSWQRAEPNTFPARAKAGGQYVNAQLMKMEAIENGYADAIALGTGGLVSEGTGMNVFLVREGVLITPVLDGSSLVGITRGAVIQMAHDLGYEVRNEPVPRESLYTADEIFFTGTAAEITPVRSVDRIPVGTGKTGPITLALQKQFMQTVRGQNDDPHGYMTYVEEAARQPLRPAAAIR
jgi:branched-chain amino acid aminotransferase